ncbi:MAG: nitrilase-related carbon-nitrogen hydrolase [Patescibacteria group bacterium]|nr:nitrilase-related carbon-nitrogen hydrolase [bacterium]MDZ4241067.1 nitrilase-related carbon-nitrogen hydrolase [Patescibacteria group bacterium]
MKWFLPLLSGLLLSLSLERPYFWWVVLLAQIPFFVFLEITGNQNKNTRREVFLGGWLLGFVFFSLTFRFILYSFPGGWAGVHNTLSAAPLFAIAWLGTSLFVSLPFGLFGLLSLKFLKIFPFITLPSLWILSEYFRAVLFGVFAWGPGATLGPHWTFGDLGYVFIDTPIVFWSRLVGLYGLSFLVVCINFFLFRIFKKEFRLIFPVTLFLLFLFYAPNLFFQEGPQEKPLNIALVHTEKLLGSLSQDDFSSLWEKAITKEKGFQQPDVVIFPEGGTLFSDDSNKTLLENIFSKKDTDGLIITSSVVSYESGTKERMIYRTQNNEILSVQDKTFLIPGGEYLPVILKAFLYFQDKTLLERFSSSRTRIPGDVLEMPVPFGDTKIGALMCSGIVSPSLYRSLANKGAEILVNSASQIVFRNEPFFLRQIKTMARFQAVSTARPFLQASNGGQSFFIDSRGDVIKESSSFEDQILFVQVSPSETKTPYTRFGDWPVIISLSVLVFSIFRTRKFRSSDPK